MRLRNLFTLLMVALAGIASAQMFIGQGDMQRVQARPMFIGQGDLKRVEVRPGVVNRGDLTRSNSGMFIGQGDLKSHNDHYQQWRHNNDSRGRDIPRSTYRYAERQRSFTSIESCDIPVTQQVVVVPVTTYVDYRPAPDWYYPLQVDVWSDRQIYDLGDCVGLSVRTDRDAFVYVYTTDTSGVTRQLLPNYYDRDNFVRGGSVKQLPSGRYRLEADSPGWETISVVAVQADGCAWVPPPCSLGYTAREPFPVMLGGTDYMRSTLQTQLYEGYRTAEYTTISTGSGTMYVAARSISVGPSRRPYWGEASTQVFTRGPVCAPAPVAVQPVYCLPEPPSNDTATLRVTSSPSCSDVYVDGILVGQTPLSVAVTSGRHEVLVSRQGFRPWQKTVKLRVFDNERVSVQLLRAY